MPNRTHLLPAGLILLSSILFFANLGGTRLWDDDEPKNAACGREMLEQGNLIVPTFNSELRSHKPVLLYWAMMVSYLLVGVNEFGARLPSVIASLGTVFLCYQIGKLLFNRSAGFAAGLFLSCGMMFTVLSRAATPDAVLIFCTTSCFYCFVLGIAKLRGGHFCGVSGETAAADLSNGSRLPLWSAIGMYVAMGMAVLAKGPVGFLLPMTVISLYVLFAPGAVDAALVGKASMWQRSLHWLGSRFNPRRLLHLAYGMRLLMGAGLVLGVALPWYMAVTVATEGAWLTGFLGTHNVNRFLNPMEGHNGPVFYYVIAILVGFFPGSVFLGPAFAKSVQDLRLAREDAQAQAFLGCWIGTYLFFFTVAATKLPNYIVPCFPALALLTAGWLVSLLRRDYVGQFWLRNGIVSFALVGTLVAAVLGWASSRFWQPDPMLVVVCLIPVVAAIVGFVLLRHQRTPAALSVCAASFLMFNLIATSFVAPRVSPFQTSPRIADQLSRMQASRGNEKVQFATFRYTKPNLVFYLGQPIPVLETPQAALDFAEQSTQHFLVLPEQEYDALRDRLPSDFTVIHREPKFMHPDLMVVVVGRSSESLRTARQPLPYR